MLEKYSKEILKTALDKACERISDSGQEYHEAKTKEGWIDYYLERANRMIAGQE